MIKIRGLIIMIIFVLLLGAANFYLFFSDGEVSYTTISGEVIKEIPKLPAGLNLSIIAFVVQWIILILVIFFAYSSFLKHKKEEKVKLTYAEIKKMETKSRTDLDILYNLLKEKKRLSIGTIANVFRIKKEKAIEWGKILENHELVTIEYPAFNDPEVRINEKEEEKPKEEIRKEQEKKEQKAEHKSKTEGKSRKGNKKRRKRKK